MDPWRPVRTADVPGVLALVGEIYAEYDCVLDLENEDRRLLDPGAWFRERGGEFWVVEEAGPVVAVVGLIPLEDAAELKSLYVHVSHRRRGLGRRLCRLVMDAARNMGKNRMILWSDTRFTNAHRLYESLGFVRRGLRELHDLNATIEYGYETSL